MTKNDDSGSGSFQIEYSPSKVVISGSVPIDLMILLIDFWLKEGYENTRMPNKEDRWNAIFVIEKGIAVKDDNE